MSTSNSKLVRKLKISLVLLGLGVITAGLSSGAEAGFLSYATSYGNYSAPSTATLGGVSTTSTTLVLGQQVNSDSSITLAGPDLVFTFNNNKVSELYVKPYDSAGVGFSAINVNKCEFKIDPPNDGVNGYTYSKSDGSKWWGNGFRLNNITKDIRITGSCYDTQNVLLITKVANVYVGTPPAPMPTVEAPTRTTGVTPRSGGVYPTRSTSSNTWSLSNGSSIFFTR